jgi:D-alanine transaminase
VVTVNFANISLVYLDGKFYMPEEVRISPFDRGFIFGDGVYEVIPVFNGRLFRLPDHLQRLAASLRAIELPNPHDDAGWLNIFQQLITAAGPGDHAIYVQITRGVAPRDHAFPHDPRPTAFAYIQPISYPRPQEIEHGVAAITLADTRWARCDIKSISLLPNVLARNLALEAGAAEAIFIRDGFVTEGAASNIFIVKGGRLYTPPKSQYLLPGITRNVVLELARNNRVSAFEAPVSEMTLRTADEIIMTSSTKELLPITKLNGLPVGDGRPGRVFRRLLEIYREYKEDYKWARV